MSVRWQVDGWLRTVSRNDVWCIQWIWMQHTSCQNCQWGWLCQCSRRQGHWISSHCMLCTWSAHSWAPATLDGAQQCVPESFPLWAHHHLSCKHIKLEETGHQLFWCAPMEHTYFKILSSLFGTPDMSIVYLRYKPIVTKLITLQIRHWVRN